MKMFIINAANQLAKKGQALPSLCDVPPFFLISFLGSIYTNEIDADALKLSSFGSCGKDMLTALLKQFETKIKELDGCGLPGLDEKLKDPTNKTDHISTTLLFAPTLYKGVPIEAIDDLWLWTAKR